MSIELRSDARSDGLDDARELPRALSEAARISRLRHDLRNDLTAVLGYAHLLAAMPGLPEAAVERALTIAKHASKMAERLRSSRELDAQDPPVTASSV